MKYSLLATIDETVPAVSAGGSLHSSINEVAHVRDLAAFINGNFSGKLEGYRLHNLKSIIHIFVSSQQIFLTTFLQ